MNNNKTPEEIYREGKDNYILRYGFGTMIIMTILIMMFINYSSQDLNPNFNNQEELGIIEYIFNFDSYFFIYDIGTFDFIMFWIFVVVFGLIMGLLGWNSIKKKVEKNETKVK